MGIAADVARMSDLSNLYAEISKRYDRLDVVFANAGTVDWCRFKPALRNISTIFSTRT